MSIEGPVVKIGADASGVKAVLDDVTRQFEQFRVASVGMGADFEKLGASMGGIGKGLTAGVTVPMTAAVGAIGLLVNQAAEFQSQLSEVFTLLPNISQEGMDQLSAGVKSLSAEYGIATNEIIPALYQAISAGIPQENVFTFLETAAQTSIGGVTSLTSAVDVLSSVTNAYGTEVLSVVDASDILFTGVKMGKTTIEELSSNMSKVAPLAASMGLSLDQVVAALDAMTMQGEGTAEAATKLKGMLAELTKEGSEADKVFKSLAGVSFKNFLSNGGTLAEALSILSEGAKSQGTDIVNFFGSVEAGMSALMLTTEQGTEKYSAPMEEMGKRQDAALTAAETRMNTATQKMAKIREQFNAELLTVGEAFLPILEKDLLPILQNDIVPFITGTMLPALKGLADWFSGLDDGSKKLALGLGAFAAALGPILMVLGPIVSAGGALITTFGGISTAAGVAAGGAGIAGLTASLGGLATAAGPAGVAIAGLAAAWIAWETDFLGVKTNTLIAVDEVTTALMDLPSVAAGAVVDVGSGFVEALNNSPVDLSFFTGNIQKSLDSITPLAEKSGYSAAKAWIDEWNSAIASGQLSVPEIPDSATPKTTNKGTEFTFPDGMSFNTTSGKVEVNGLTFQGLNTTPVDNSIQNALANQKAVDALISGLPTSKELSDAAKAGTQQGVTSASPDLANALTEKTGLEQAMKDYAKDHDLTMQQVQKMVDGSDVFKQSLESGVTVKPGASPLPVTVQSSPTGPSSTSSETPEAPLGHVTDTFSKDPARFFQQKLNQFYDGSVTAMEDYLSGFGQTIEDGARKWFVDEKSKGFGGSWDFDQWWGVVQKGIKTDATPGLDNFQAVLKNIGLTGDKAASVFGVVNQALLDNVAYNGEALGYLAKFNQQTGKATQYTSDQVDQTTDLMNALGSLNNAQSLYQTAMSDGVVTSDEASAIQKTLADATRLMGEASVTATSDISGLPGALQALASAAQSAMSQINAAVAMANTQVNNIKQIGDWKLQTLSGLPTIAPSTPTNFHYASGGPVTQNGPAYLHQGEYVLRRDEVRGGPASAPVIHNHINMQGSKFGQADMAKDIPKLVARATRRSLSRYGV